MRFTESALPCICAGQIVIPADIRARYALTAGSRVEFVDEGGVIRLLIRPVPVSDPTAGFGLVKVRRAKAGIQRRLSDFDSADQLMRRNEALWRLVAEVKQTTHEAAAALDAALKSCAASNRRIADMEAAHIARSLSKRGKLRYVVVRLGAQR